MFGINNISWEKFAAFMALLLLVWYAGLLVQALFVRKAGSARQLFEELPEMGAGEPPRKPVAVRVNDFPAEMIPWELAEVVPLAAGLYEENGVDEGFLLDKVSHPDRPTTEKLEQHVHFQL